VNIAHLARRFAGSLSRRLPSVEDVAWATEYLLPAELELWRRFDPSDQRHTIAVAKQFQVLRPVAPRPEMAGALLHDIGKLECSLGTVARVVATVVGPRTARLRTYHDHESIGAQMLLDAGSDPATIDLVLGRGPGANDLHSADNE
jgi:hypothetical protein